MKEVGNEPHISKFNCGLSVVFHPAQATVDTIKMNFGEKEFTLSCQIWSQWARDGLVGWLVGV